MEKLYTIGDLCKVLNRSYSAIHYLVLTKQIIPYGVAGCSHIFDKKNVEELKKHFDRKKVQNEKC